MEGVSSPEPYEEGDVEANRRKTNLDEEDDPFQDFDCFGEGFVPGSDCGGSQMVVGARCSSGPAQEQSCVDRGGGRGVDDGVGGESRAGVECQGRKRLRTSLDDEDDVFAHLEEDAVGEGERCGFPASKQGVGSQGAGHLARVVSAQTPSSV